MATEPGHKILELVVYGLKDGTTREEFLDAYDALSSWLVSQPGFVSRELSHAATEDRWVEIVWWNDREHAESAADAAMSSPDCAPFFEAVDMDSALLLHAEPAAAPVLGGRPVPSSTRP